MNCTSAGVAVANVGLVEDGRVVVGWPGAPGWTTNGVLGSACWALTVSDNKRARVPAANSPLRQTATAITDMEDLTLSQSGPNFLMRMVFRVTVVARDGAGPHQLRMDGIARGTERVVGFS